MGESVLLHQELLRFVSDCLSCAGVPRDDADWTAHTLVRADIWGRSTHGVSRLLAYVRGIERGKINPTPSISITRTAMATVTVDGDDGLGPVVAKVGMEHAILCAKESGVGAASVRRGNHAGALGIYTAMAAQEGFVALAFTNAQPAIAPWGGRKAFFGTNPIAMSAGRGDQQITVDLATSVVARGNIILAAKEGKPIPEGWAMDERGVPTTDAKAALSGAVLPMAGPKGYSLALLVEVLAGVLSGSAVGDQVGSIYDDRPEAPDTGMFFLALNPEMFGGRQLFESRLFEMEEEIHHAPIADGVDQIYLPGERKREMAREREASGIPLCAQTVAELEQLAQQFSLRVPKIHQGEQS